ncbi:metallophosphoesterase [methane-oxidizing endosymbiont of Gigantopelta aegis]|uniref:metallophosphoesterase n=1 Tax=methane-oxidizing endosymbiont of Gigantopelta aegis TaxID=2794938 RepID=UPI0018DECB9A|nr:metallophosphoesterase [methane-oxidizing endosymbiont of Gigantopelta aegis]
MKIYLTSDLHTEHAQEDFDPFHDYPCLQFNTPDEADVIVLAGDIGNKTCGLEWASHRFKGKKIIYVAGNHEYYDADLNILEDLRSKAKELGIYFLENEAVIIEDVRFLGCTLWTNFNQYSRLETFMAWKVMNDYYYITCKDWWENKQNKEKALSIMDDKFGFDSELFSPVVAYCLHRKSVEWLEHKLNQPYEGKTVVVTHHAPTMNLTEDYAYGSHLEKFIKNRTDKIDVWMHGHIHESEDSEIAGVRIVSNPRGYPLPGHLSESFDEKKLIWL